MYEDERLKKIEQLLIKHDNLLQNLSGKDEAQKRYMRDLMSNLNEDNVPSLRLKVTSGQMTAAIEAYATEAEAAIDLKLTGYYTAAALDLMITDVESNISLVAKYTGQDGVITVDVWNTSGKDTTKVYFATDTGKYYKYNGAEWVGTDSVSTAAFILSAINGQSTIKMKADNIDFTGVSTFLTADDLSEEGTTVIHGSRLDNESVATTSFKKRRDTGNIDWLDFYAGIDFTVIDETADDYYPDTRQINGIKSLRLYEDSSLISGHGGAGNVLYQTGQLSIGTSTLASPLASSNGGIILSNTKQYGTLALASVSRVEVAAVDMATLWSGNNGTGCLIAVTPTTIVAQKYSNGSLAASATIL